MHTEAAEPTLSHVDRIKRDLMEPRVELRETHISLVFLGADEVLKVKKPVSLGFLDFTDLATRRACCEREVELNRRLAPDVYRDVVPITADARGRLSVGGTGTPVEWAVRMRRLPDRDCADRMLVEGRFGGDEVRLIAQRAAQFHERARCDAETTASGASDVVEHNVRENFEQAEGSALRFIAQSELAAIERFQLSFLERYGHRLARRERAGKVRDGHGDLRLEHCYLSAAGALSIIDCIEFNDRFRYADVASDIAFLAMDLVWHDAAI